jgi:hypothetical protein
MSTKKKRLIIHIGQPKTGSTALQYFFSKYHEELKKNNIDYPRPEGKNVLNTGSCVGNLVKIVYEERLHKQKIKITDSIIFRDIWKDDYVSLIKDITENSPCDTVIFSAEGISGLSKNAFEKMKGYLEDFFDVEFIIFMRDPYELFYSNWKQWLKVNFITDDFKTFTLEKFLSPSKFDLSNPFEVPDTANMKIINYDTYKHELVKTFLEVTQLHFEIPLEYQSSQLFNRSFTDSEAYLQLLINRQFKNTSFPFFFRMLLLKRDAHSRDHSIQFYDKEIHTLILNHLKPKLVSINKIIHGEPLSLEVKKINASASQSIEKEDVEVLVSALSMSKQTQNKKISLSQKMSHYYKCIRKKNIPFSFDPEAYLILNLDVKDSGMDPYDHFTQYGIYENRPYKYM